MASRKMTYQEFNRFTDQVGKTIQEAGCEYILAIFPPIDGVESADSDIASIDMSIEDTERAARFFSRVIMQGGELGWRLLMILQKTCKMFPVPLLQILAASQADYQYMTGLQVFKSESETESVTKNGIIPPSHSKIKSKK